MFKRCSRKSSISIAIICLTLATVCLLGAESGNTAIFSATQRWTVVDSGWSALCEYDWNTGAWTCTPTFFGGFTYTYTLPFGAIKSFYVWDDPFGWDEGIHLHDFNL